MPQLHITNGDDITNNIRELGLPGEIIVWREMLCEGPTTVHLGSESFIKLRKDFLESTYNISSEDYDKQFIEELNTLTVSNGYDEIVLWFEFDLFSHINMLAVISHLMENKKTMPVYLVCSKKLKDEKEFFPLSQLPLKHLKNHYDQRILLNQDDLETANLVWQLYNGDNPQKLIGQIKKKTNFEYLSSCMRAHIERFPNSITGINSLEQNILKLIEKNNITSMNQLIGYALQYQGYFGLGELQIRRLIDSLNLFYKVEDNRIVLTEEGKEALNASRNFYRELKNDECLGGVKKFDFLYDADSHKILKL
jgi:hypothetical protein